MRRIAVLLVAVAVAASMVGAAHGVVARTTGGVYLGLSDGAGLAKVRNRGNFFGRVGRGKIVASKNVLVNGCESRRETSNRIRCTGRRLTFNTVGADRWRLKLRGRGINGTGFVSGCLVLDGRNSGSTGNFSRGNGEQPWPRSRTWYPLGSGNC
jgi:hypothetical protein